MSSSVSVGLLDRVPLSLMNNLELLQFIAMSIYDINANSLMFSYICLVFLQFDKNSLMSSLKSRLASLRHFLKSFLNVLLNVLLIVSLKVRLRVIP